MVKAYIYLNEAIRLLNSGDPYDAAEKVWAAVRDATIALTTKYLGEAAPPKGVSWRRFVKNALVKAGLSEGEADRWAAYFVEVRSKLHGDCFYGLNYEEDEHKPLMDKAREYVDLVKRLIRD